MQEVLNAGRWRKAWRTEVGFGDTLRPHTQEQEVKSESDFVRQARSLHAALSVGTGAEDLLAASILGAGRVVVVG